jgi:hypothetical protein
MVAADAANCVYGIVAGGIEVVVVGAVCVVHATALRSCMQTRQSLG